MRVYVAPSTIRGLLTEPLSSFFSSRISMEVGRMGPIHVTHELLAKGIETKMGIHPNRTNPSIGVRRNF